MSRRTAVDRPVGDQIGGLSFPAAIDVGGRLAVLPQTAPRQSNQKSDV